MGGFQQKTIEIENSLEKVLKLPNKSVVIEALGIADQRIEPDTDTPYI